ncbi:MAG: tRNA pseudouridine(38-40) synthase TruA [Solirubrobacterales bacterium]|nr:tRNA pseudouridine(38-40) synthase TruA [Solirubrobacterales bacterium]
MSFVRLDLAYDGTEFAGWATQPGMRTVQADLEAALEQVLGEQVALTVAGRTDAGVHAWGQVASFELPGREPPEELRRALNAITGRDVEMLGAKAVPVGFDARRDARSRTYCFRLYCSPQPSPFERGRSLYWRHRIHPGLLERCAEAVMGTHDFSAFTPTQTRHVRFEREVLRAEWKRGRSYAPGLPPDVGNAELFELWIEANSFLRGMVRSLVGTMLEVGSGRRDFDDFTSLLSGAPREEAGDTAQAHGLYLASVRY